MKELRTGIVIHASPEKIWKTLTDFSKYPLWNPMVKSLEGKFREGEKITVKLQQPGSKVYTFKPTLTQIVAGKEFRWRGRLLFSWLFEGEHFFRIEDNNDGSCHFAHGENFKGILVPLFENMIEQNTKAGFEGMNEKLKERCEK